MIRVATAVLLAAALAGCGSAPKKAPSPPPAERVPPPAQADGPKRSPYAPAQEDPSKRGDYVAGGLYAPGVSDSAPDDIPDVDAIPEPEVKAEPPSRIGNRDYTVLGKRYEVLGRADGYVEEGLASFYGKKFHGRKTSNHEVYDMYAFTAAHRSLPLPSFARVTNLANGKSVVVRVNDRGPFHSARIIDLSYAAAAKLGFIRQGTARVEVRALTPGDGDDGPALAAAGPAKPAGPAAAPAAAPAAVPADPALPADEFERWMRERGIRVATGVPARPGAAAATTAVADPAPTPETPVATASLPAPADGVLLQLAAYAARENAERARDRLAAAGLGPARIDEARVEGRPVWRLRLGPVPADRVSDLSRRAAELGFTPARVVHD
ncbi:MAG: septal ring lytic transglycosylase RlpA family protein [Xanthomonadales bacterium]|nr:septal ring lytic transglycosylase RlpA family protein [Xanthomonadales bacterium]